mmetsp:Transcript_40470/g.81112  ORF Transcript_40470/g.81112 Transcript_40470/m.81112 type:complete len:238 (-) Transcript_40470:1123-1836(-)
MVVLSRSGSSGRLIRCASRRLLSLVAPEALTLSACRLHALDAFERDGKFTPETLATLTASMPPTRVSLNQLSMAARKATPQQFLLNAVFINSELIARRAAVLQQFQQMPPELATSAGVQELASKYEQRLSNLIRLPRPRTAEDEEAFASSMRQALPDQLGETRRAFGESLAQLAADGLPRERQVVIDRHIDRIFLSRVGIRFLVKHYLASREPTARAMTVCIIYIYMQQACHAHNAA